ncbi:MAG: peptidylprolyl isomerase [Limisphaerales bacterium]
MNRLVLSALLLGALGVQAQNKPLSMDELFPPKIVVQGTGFTITEKDIAKELTAYKAAAAADGRPIDDTSQELLKQRITDRMVFVKTMLLKATAQDRANAVDRADELLKKTRQGYPSDDAFRRYLTARGISFAEFKQKWTDQAIVEHVLKREVYELIPVSEAEMKRYYLDNIGRFRTRDAVKISHILARSFDPQTNKPLDARQKAAALGRLRGLLARVKAGEDIQKLAREHSEDPGSKDRGGVYVFGRNQYSVKFETAAFGLAIGQVSDVVETDYGYHIIKLLDRQQASTLPYEKVTKQLQFMIKRDKGDQKMPDYVRAMHIRYRVNYLDKSYQLPESERRSPPRSPGQ